MDEFLLLMLSLLRDDKPLVLLVVDELLLLMLSLLRDDKPLLVDELLLMLSARMSRMACHPAISGCCLQLRNGLRAEEFILDCILLHLLFIIDGALL